jgi:hypothetical protein
MKNVRYAMAKGKKSGHKGHKGVLSDRPMKSDIAANLRGHTWPGQKTVMGPEKLKER